MSEYVYLIRAGAGHKIGRTNNLERRLVELKTYARLQYGGQPVLVHAIETCNAMAIERELHRIFKPWREVGRSHEWYDLPPSALAWICAQSDPLGRPPNRAEMDEYDREERRRSDPLRLATLPEAAQILGIDKREILLDERIELIELGAGAYRVRLVDVYRVKAILDDQR